MQAWASDGRSVIINFSEAGDGPASFLLYNKDVFSPGACEVGAGGK